MATTTRYTVIDGEILSENRNNVKHDYVPDALGNTIALLDNTQTQTDTFSYYPYGEVASRTGTTATPFQYIGTLGYYQDNSGRTYVRARHLRTAHGRWMTQDPIGFDGGDFNLYRYVENGPLAYVDPLGLRRCPQSPPGACFWCYYQLGLRAGNTPADACSIAKRMCGSNISCDNPPDPLPCGVGPYKPFTCTTRCNCTGPQECSGQNDGVGSDADELEACRLAKKDAISKCEKPCSGGHCDGCKCSKR